MVTTIKDSLPSLFITLLIAFLGGLLCQTLDFPAPFLLGSLFFHVHFLAILVNTKYTNHRSPVGFSCLC